MGWHLSALLLDGSGPGRGRDLLRALGVPDPGPSVSAPLDEALNPIGVAVGNYRRKTILTGSAVLGLMFDDAGMLRALEAVSARRAVAIFVEDSTNAYYYACYEDGRRVCARGGAADEDEIVEGVSWSRLLPEELDYFGGPPERDASGRPVLIDAQGRRFEHHQIGAELGFAVAARVLGAPFDTMDDTFYATRMEVFEEVEFEDRRARREVRRHAVRRARRLTAAGRTKSFILWSLAVLAALALALSLG